MSVFKTSLVVSGFLVFASCATHQASPQAKALEEANHAAYSAYLDCLDQQYEALVVDLKRKPVPLSEEAQVACNDSYLAYVNSREALIEASTSSGVQGSAHRQASHGAEQKKKEALKKLVDQARAHRAAHGIPSWEVNETPDAQ